MDPTQNGKKVIEQGKCVDCANLCPQGKYSEQCHKQDENTPEPKPYKYERVGTGTIGGRQDCAPCPTDGLLPKACPQSPSPSPPPPSPSPSPPPSPSPSPSPPSPPCTDRVHFLTVKVKNGCSNLKIAAGNACRGAGGTCREDKKGRCVRLLSTGRLQGPLIRQTESICANADNYCSCCCGLDPASRRYLADGPTPDEALEHTTAPSTTELDAIGKLSALLPPLDLDDNVLAAGATLPPSWRARAQQEGVGRRLDATTNPDDDNCIGSLEGGVSGTIEPHERVGRIISLPNRALSAALRAD